MEIAYAFHSNVQIKRPNNMTQYDTKGKLSVLNLEIKKKNTKLSPL